MKPTTEKLRFYSTFVPLLATFVGCEVALGQSDLRTVMVRDWEVHASDYKALLFADGLASNEPEERALALAGISRLALEDLELSRARFAMDEIATYFDDGDADVVKQAMRAYVSLAESDETAETEIIVRAQRGGGPLQAWEYIRYLRPEGITSDEARDWLLELASGPVSENKQSAAAVLVREPGMPPPSLLPEVMQLIRSPEYFCYPNLTQFVPRFGSDAVGYLEELKELRVILSNRIGTAAGLRLAGSQQLDAVDLEMMDNAIMAIENMSTAN